MSKRALIVAGGWEGHEPEKVADLFCEILEAENFKVSVRQDLDAFLDTDLTGPNLIIPIWTMGEITYEQRKAVTDAVMSGVGLAGCHGGMCDSFRNDTEWQFMTGGQWVAHPGNDGVRYAVHIDRSKLHPITDGLPDFDVESEQYYLHTDPGNIVLAYCEFPTPGVGGPHEGNPCRMPQVWTKAFGAGKVFYNALGHQATTLASGTAREIMRRGFLWAAQ